MRLLPTLSNSEMTRLGRGVFGKVIVVALVAIPSLYGGLLVWSNVDPTGHLDSVPAAIVNEDEPARTTDANGKKQTVPLGRIVTGKLVDNDDPSNLAWRITDADDASEGLEDGRYYAVLTIPKDFSAAATSTSDANAARTAPLRLETNDATSYLAGNIGQSVAREVTASTGDELTKTYLDRIYLGFNDIQKQMTEAGKGARQLEDGTGQLREGTASAADGSQQLTVGLNRLAGGSGELVGGVNTLAGGAGRLAAGAGRLADGNQQLAQGLGSAAKSTEALPQQTRALASGATQLADGNARLAAGADELADGLESAQAALDAVPSQTSQFTQGVDALVTGLRRLGDGAQRLQTGTKPLTQGATAVADGADDLAAGAKRLDAGAGRLADGTSRLAESAGQLDTATGRYTGAVSDLADDCADSGASAAFCARLRATAARGDALTEGTSSLASGADDLSDAATQARSGTAPLAQGAQRVSQGARRVATGAGALDQGVTELGTGTSRLTTGSQRLADGVEKLAGELPKLNQGVTRAATGARSLSDGATQLAGGARRLETGLDALATAAPQLAGGIKSAATAANQLAAGANQLETGATTLAGGAAKAASGAQQLDQGTKSAASGAQDLHQGTSKLADGAERVDDGASDLASGITEGAEQVPTYDKRQRERLGSVVAEPVSDDAVRLHRVGNYGAGLAPYFLSIGLWVGGMAIFFLFRPLSRRAMASTASPVRVALAGLAPPAVLGVVQAVVVTSLLHTVVGIEIARFWPLMAFAVLASLTFVAINQALVASLGSKGRFLGLVLIVLQLASAGATYPIETSPGFFGFLHPLLPMTHSVAGFRTLIAGGHADATGQAAVLGLWLFGALLVTVLAARRGRRWSAERLHPQTAEV